MARKKTTKRVEVENYSHKGSSRKNIPPAKIASEGKIPKQKHAVYSYSPHLTPNLRFDSTGDADRLTAIVDKACSGQSLTKKEQDIIQAVARNAEQPWLEWAAKTEEQSRGVLEVDPVALHIHERVSSNAIVRAAMRDDIQRDLFADPEQDYQDAVQFYQHDVDWANRLILGDSMQVMSSLSRRENLSGKVQMIYMDPPYGIKFASNFQVELNSREVKDNDKDLTREPEMVKAYRDTWHLGTHSYLSYLRDRLLVAKELLAECGSIFLQIGAENLHRVRLIMDEVFGHSNFVSVITVRKTATPSRLLDDGSFYLLWYGKSAQDLGEKFNHLHVSKPCDEWARDTPGGSWGVEIDGIRRSLLPGEKQDTTVLPDQNGVFCLSKLTSSGGSSNPKPFCALGQTFELKANEHWKTTEEGLERLIQSERIEARGRAWFVKYYRDGQFKRMNNVWVDTAGKSEESIYVVQTQTEVIKRCMLMTSDPGDLVLDPTCGSGTTAYVAEQWGRKWITIDTSRVAISLARQRLLTAKYDRYKILGETGAEHDSGAGRGVDPAANFLYKTVPHVTLGSIAKNENLDPIFKKYQVELDENLTDLNHALKSLNDVVRKSLVGKLAEKIQDQGLRYVTDADRRRWVLPGTSEKMIKEAFSGKSKLKPKHVSDYAAMIPPGGVFAHWHVPYDSDPDWPAALAAAVVKYRKVWADKMGEVNACISDNADQERLVDRPVVANGVLRVSGPFSVEGVRQEEFSINEDGELFDPTPNDWDEDGQNASAYLDRMLHLLRKDGVTFPNNEHRKFTRIESLNESDSALHAEGAWGNSNVKIDKDIACNVAIAFGPQYGPVTAEQVEDLIRASRRYDELVIAAFSFDGASQEIIQESANPRLKIHMAHIRPDVSPGMDGLLKDTPNSQLFTVFGQPEIEVRTNDDGDVEVELLGVDIYSPLTGEVRSAGASKVAAWFLDSDYDSRCFCVTQAFFPNQKAWDKIAKALGSTADTEAFNAYKGTVSIPFAPGKHRRIAVKVIDPRGNEVMAIRSLEGGK